jgi:hypothetical protein
MSDCVCEFGLACNGTGTIFCDGCGGDLCICLCGGEMPCEGCLYCDREEEWPLPEEEATQ